MVGHEDVGRPRELLERRQVHCVGLDAHPQTADASALVGLKRVEEPVGVPVRAVEPFLEGRRQRRGVGRLGQPLRLGLDGRPRGHGLGRLAVAVRHRAQVVDRHVRVQLRLGDVGGDEAGWARRGGGGGVEQPLLVAHHLGRVLDVAQVGPLGLAVDAAPVRRQFVGAGLGLGAAPLLDAVAQVAGEPVAFVHKGLVPTGALAAGVAGLDPGWQRPSGSVRLRLAREPGEGRAALRVGRRVGVVVGLVGPEGLGVVGPRVLELHVGVWRRGGVRPFGGVGEPSEERVGGGRGHRCDVRV